MPITRDQIRMLLEGNACPPDDLETLGIESISFSGEALDYLDSDPRDTVTTKNDTPDSR